MNFSDLDDFRIRADVFSVGAVEEKFRDMTVKFNRKDYGEAVAMAKTLIESTCAYVYHAVTSTEIAEEKGRQDRNTGIYTIGMFQEVQETLNLFEPQLPNLPQTAEVAKNICELVQSIANLRNSSAAAHGARLRSVPPSNAEALLAMEVAEDLSGVLLTLLHTFRYPDDSNVIGSFISVESDMVPFPDKDEPDRYVQDDQQVRVTYEVIQSVIQSIDIEFKTIPLNPDVDNEFVFDTIKDYLPRDAKFTEKEAALIFKFYSNVHDKNYRALLSQLGKGSEIIISALEQQEPI